MGGPGRGSGMFDILRRHNTKMCDKGVLGKCARCMIVQIRSYGPSECAQTIHERKFCTLCEKKLNDKKWVKNDYKDFQLAAHVEADVFEKAYQR